MTTATANIELPWLVSILQPETAVALKQICERVDENTKLIAGSLTHLANLIELLDTRIKVLELKERQHHGFLKGAEI